MSDAKTIFEGIKKGDRRSLAKGISLVENSLNQYRNEAQQLVENCLALSGHSVRIAISGPPGVGKSTLIEVLGKAFIRSNHRTAVLAIDPSSPLSGGSILGDKTRMNDLSVNEMAFVRPSPSGLTPGGVARSTRDSIILCEAAGYDVILVETVGVGQAEYTAASMVDLFLLVEMPGSGDDLQGIKRGILELADFIVVNKADGERKQLAFQSKAQLQLALRGNTQVIAKKILSCSALENQGIEELKNEIFKFIQLQKKSGAFEKRREAQVLKSLDEEIETTVIEAMNVAIRKKLQPTYLKLQTQVVKKECSLRSAANLFLKEFAKD